MADVVYKMYGTAGAGTNDSVVQIDVQADGVIDVLYLDLTATGMDALADLATVEIGFGSTNTFTSNDVRSSIATVELAQNLLTNGGGAQGKSVTIPFSRGIPVAAGERIHMHIFASTGVTVRARAYLYTIVRSLSRARSRNR